MKDDNWKYSKGLYNDCGMTSIVHSFPNERRFCIETGNDQGTVKLLVIHFKGEELRKGSNNYTVVYTPWTFHPSVTVLSPCFHFSNLRGTWGIDVGKSRSTSRSIFRSSSWSLSNFSALITVKIHESVLKSTGY